MVDNTCGPSNALQNLQKHSSVNRSLQNDRLVSQNPLSQEFRSAQFTNDRMIEAEFEEFQSRQPSLRDNTFQVQAFKPSQLNPQQFEPSSWASDFQMLSLSNTASLVHSNSTFSRSFDRESYKDVRQPQFNERFSPVVRNSRTGFIGMKSQNLAGFIPLQMEEQILEQEHLNGNTFDSEAFARAFDEASKTGVIEDFASNENQNELNQEALIDKSVSTEESADVTSPLKDDVYLSQARIGADSFENEKKKLEDDTDALSSVATKLLNSLNHEKSSKFQNSQFLELMRRFRDKEATIEKDHIVSTKKNSP